MLPIEIESESVVKYELLVKYAHIVKLYQVKSTTTMTNRTEKHCVVCVYSLPYLLVSSTSGRCCWEHGLARYINMVTAFLSNVNIMR